MMILSENMASKKLDKLLIEVSNSHYPIKIKGKKTNGVLVSESDWKAIEETLYLLSIPNMRESIIEGIKTPVENC